MSKTQAKRPTHRPAPPPTDTRILYTIQRRVTAREVGSTVASDGPPLNGEAWIDGTTYDGKVEADRALADLAVGGVFRVARVWPAVELTVEKRDVVTNRKPV